MTQILIVGGAGYIGSHFILRALETGHEVIVLDDLSAGSKQAVLGGTFYQGDLSDRELLRKIFAQHNIAAVFHFAAFIQVEESVAEPCKYYENNVAKTLVLLDEMRKAEIKKFIFSSTAAVYGEPDYVPIDVGHPTRPINPYGASKLMVEQIVQDFGVAYGLQYSILRYFNAASADPKGRIGFHEPIMHLIPNVLKAANGREKQVEIYGADYNTPDGTCIRDYIHVVDLVEAHLLALKKLRQDQKSHILNLGNGQGFSVREVIAAVKRVTHKEFSIIELPRRVGDPAHLAADATLAKQFLGWQPKYAELDKIVTDAWQWELHGY